MCRRIFPYTGRPDALDVAAIAELQVDLPFARAVARRVRGSTCNAQGQFDLGKRESGRGLSSCTANRPAYFASRLRDLRDSDCCAVAPAVAEQKGRVLECYGVPPRARVDQCRTQ